MDKKPISAPRRLGSAATSSKVRELASKSSSSSGLREVSASGFSSWGRVKKNLMRINLTQTTVPHTVLGRFGSGMVLLKPAPEGTGVIAGGAVRAVMTSAGVQNVLTKSIGTTNPHNVIKATFDALKKLKNREDVAALRGKSVQEL